MALSAQRPPKRVRLTCKTNMQSALLDSVLGGEEPSAAREVYLVTFPHPSHAAGASSAALAAPGTFTREAIRDAMLHACEAPVHDAGWLRRHPGFVPQPVEVRKLVVFREYHVPDGQGQCHAHYHVALCLAQPTRFMPLKRALLQGLQLATHWSCSHIGYWSTVRYGITPSPQKPRTALDPAPVAWSRDGVHPPLAEAAIEPTTACALRSRREHAVASAMEKGKAEPRVEDIDMWALVVESRIRNSPTEPHAASKLMAYAKTHASHKVVAWLFKNEEKIPKIIDKAWAWEEVDSYLEDATQSPLQLFHEAHRRPCVCAGRWLHHVHEAFAMNRIDVSDLCSSVLASLEHGRAEDLPVVTLAGRFGGEGKSLFFAPLRPMFGTGFVQERPPGGNFSLLGLSGKKVAVLDEWLFAGEDLPLPMQLLWLEGKPVPICTPQNQQLGHSVYEGSAPIFVTTPEDALAGLSQTSAEQPRGHAGMLLRRLKVFLFTVPIAKPQPPRISPCPCCFARLVTAAAAK